MTSIGIIGKLKKIPGFESIIGLPAYLVFE